MLDGDDTPVPYGSPDLQVLLASQLVRQLRDYSVVDLAELSDGGAKAPSLIAT
ncbi:hypothetical protein [Streptomyces sp. NPDC001876]|uniref:hypothetical protein n=1 Tax=Streptomyces sp. NPDC001876 TaxID=3154402 RepID=UPI0033188881